MNKLHSNTEVMSEKEAYAYLVQVSEFLKKYYELDINSEVDRENNYDPMGWLFQWKKHMKEMSIELFNSFIYGNLISAAAMTKLALFLFYSSIYNKFYIMMRYIFKTI